MKRNSSFIRTMAVAALSVCVALVAGSCRGNDPFGPGGDTPGGGSSVTADISGLTDFEVAFNTAALSEQESVPSGDADYVENATFAGTITVTYDGSSAKVTGDTDGVTSVSGADVTVAAGKSYCFVLTGSSDDGSFTVSSSPALAIRLNGLTLANKDGAAISIQQKDTVYVVAEEGTVNTLTDGGRTSDDAKVKGAFYTKGKAIFSGKGTLNVTGNYKNGIDVKKALIIRPNTNIYVSLSDTIQKGACIKCESDDAGEGLTIKGGVLNLDNPSVAGKGMASDGELTVSGGRVTAICTGAGMWDTDDLDVSGSAGIKADGCFTISGGELWLKSTGAGGKGISGDSLLTFAGGTTHVITTGSTQSYTYNKYTYDASPKGIKTDRDIYVTGGTIYVRASGTTEGSEGIEAKQTYNQSGGTVMIYAADDGLNTGYGSESLQEKKKAGLNVTGLTADQGRINVSGGTLYSYSSGNDGIDSNGYISISGGTVVGFGTNAPETSIDCDQDSRYSVTGGVIFGMGGSAPNTPGASCTQCYAITSFTSVANTEYTVKASDGTEIITVTVPRAYSNGALLVSSPDMAKSTTYTIGSSSFTTGSSWITSNYSSSGTGGGGNPGGGTTPGGGGNPGGGTTPGGQGGGGMRP